MDILLVQAETVWQSPEANYRRIEALVGKSGEADLIVLPEMFPTGFVTGRSGVIGAADKDGTRILEWMRAFARETGAAVVGSAAVEADGWFFNRCYFVRPDGSFDSYDKRHLFGIGGEDEHYTAGHDRTVVEWGGFRILLLVCYDLRFPVFARNRGDYDMILCVANWPQSRRRVWDTLLRARAIENVCYVAGVNRVGSDPVCAYNGGTAFIDYRGESVGTVEDGSEGVLRVSAELDGLAAFRRKYPMLDDADAFELRFE